MAQSSKDKLNQHARIFKEKLEALGCPYTEDVDEAWVIDLLFKPGEHRIRLLQWLFSKFDSRLNDILDPRCFTTPTKMDSRIQRLLYVASSLGLCSQDDADLIRGCGSTSKQFTFIENLLDLVYIMDRSEDPQARSMKSPGMVSEGTSIQEQFYSDCWFMDSLAEQEKLDTVLMSEAKLLPPDINKQLMLKAKEKEQRGESTELELPDTAKLQELAARLSKDLQRQEEILEELKQAHEYPKDDSQSVENIQCAMRLVLSELSQILIGFSYCFDNELHPWCNKTPPQLTGLGPAFKRIWKLLEHFAKMLCGVGEVRSSHNSLCLHLPEQVKTLASDFDRSPDGIIMIHDFQECIGILEDSLVRAGTSTPQTTFNTSVMSNIVKFR